MRKIHLLSGLAGVLVIICLTSCGSGGGSSKKLPSNKYLGDIPAAIIHYNAMDSVIKAEEEAKYKKLGDKISIEKMKEISMESETRQKENNQKLKDAVAKANETLVGAEIPCEVKSHAYEVSGMKISNVYAHSVKMKGAVKILEEMPAPVVISFSRHARLYYVFVDSNGEIINKGITDIDLKDYKKEFAEPGEEYELDIILAFHSKVSRYVNFAKIIFITEEEYNTV